MNPRQTRQKDCPGDRSRSKGNASNQNVENPAGKDAILLDGGGVACRACRLGCSGARLAWRRP